MSDIRCSKNVDRALGAFAAARTIKEFNAAKRLMARLEPVHQMAMVDSMLATARRVGL